MPDVTISQKYEQAFYQWLTEQYGWQAWIIKQMYGRAPFFQGQNPYYDFWLSAGKPIERIANAPPVQRQWQPSGMGEKPYGPEMPPEVATAWEGRLEAEPWLKTGQTQEEYYAERPWERIGVEEEAFRVRQTREMYGYPPEEEAEPGLTPYQQWQTGFQERQFAWTQSEAQRRQREAAWQGRSDYAQMRIQAFQQGQGGREGMTQTDKARIYESIRNEILSGMGTTSDRDWIKYWQVKNAPNRYAQEEPEMTATDRVRKWSGEVDRFLAMHKRATEMGRKAASDPEISLSFGEKQYMEYSRRGLTNAYENLAEAELAQEEMYAETPGARRVTPLSESRGEGRQERLERQGRWKPRPWHPETPAWLSKFYPEKGERELWGERTTGWRPKLAPPSAQAYSRLLPSERQKWMGYAEYLGQDPLDLMQQTAQMIPQSPWKTRAKWTPAKQR